MSPSTQGSVLAAGTGVAALAPRRGRRQRTSGASASRGGSRQPGAAKTSGIDRADAIRQTPLCPQAADELTVRSGRLRILDLSIHSTRLPNGSLCRVLALGSEKWSIFES